MSDFLGTGWAFPPLTDGRGGIGLVSGDEDIIRAIRIILETPVGARVMRPTFGSRLHQLVFAPFSADTFGQAITYVQEALGFWEPRIDVLNVEVGTDPDEAQRMLIRIDYRVKATHDERSLVYPFYNLPGE